MAMTDPIAACLTSIRNAVRAKKPVVTVPGSKLKNEIVRVLAEEGFIGAFEVQKQGIRSLLHMTLKYTATGRSVIHEIKRVSKPGCRVYRRSEDIKVYRNGLGVQILSTPKGVITDRSARREKIGGEILCSIW